MYKGERFNSLSHLAGTAAAVVGLVLLLVRASAHDAWRIAACAIYGLALANLYLSSTLYHSVRGPAKAWLRKFDHVSIYLLIAGTYTPFTLVLLRDSWGWPLFGMEWTLALIGATLDVRHQGGSRAWQVGIYILMGWLIVLALEPLRRVLPDPGFWLLVAGGVVYTIGILFYAVDERMRHAHGIWHVFVLVASVCHYLAVLLFIA